MTPTKAGTAHLLTLPEIAAWQIAYPPAKVGSIVATLPALQRGAVWKVKQIEELWDSILRRFPIGAFVIAPPNDDLKQQNFKLQPECGELPAPTHLLLDGQQRATGIALGFYDLWRDGEKEAHAKGALWLDLAEPYESSEAEFIFRAVTRAHPWGYKRTNPDEPLSAHQIRAALLAFRAANQCDDKRSEEFSLWQTWPWDAEAPVPLVMLVEAAISHADDLAAARDTAWKRIQKLPMFAVKPSLATNIKGNERVVKESHDGLEKQCKNLSVAFEKEDTVLYRRLDSVLRRLQKILVTEQIYQIPALPLDLQTPELSEATDADANVTSAPPTLKDAAKKDAIELLFVRVNSAGTPLAGEELIYSLLKAAWPDAAKFIDGLDHKPALPSRIAMLCVRMILARRQLPAQERQLAMPPVPSVNEFRRLVRNQNPNQPNFKKELKSFIENEANSLFSDAWKFLTDKSFALLPVLAVELAQKSPDVYFLLLRWLDRLRMAKISSNDIDETTHRRTLGFLTALAWFAPEKTKACSAIWSELQAEVANNRQLLDRFNGTRFRKACRIDANYSLRMIPLPCDDELELACKKFVIGHNGCRNTISNADSTIWSGWDWHTSLADKLAEKENKDEWVKRLRPESEQESSDAPDLSESTIQATRHFFDTLYESHSILLYAQRSWLKKWYPHFDPSVPEFMEDKNRPWDYDHILPQNLLRTDAGNSQRNIPQVIWDWCGSIGNLRAWPLEANRADSDTSPAIKFVEVSEEDKRYFMQRGEDERKASFVQEDLDWPCWQRSVPMTEDNQVEKRRYLALAGYHDYRNALIKAIVLRFIALYREWYKELRVNELQ
ncbi:hypothetical protein FEMY_22430 [Ferrovum myxofaciens]|uniref:GmrSD restriction endonucleases N-terminal domain-containing protein n=1 Tax=Ferrovum myxofaciens TaxID=416213 RepID=A0A149VVP2_9PROT|nr:DUF262 domain-containing protein [Ferrovum myxofaciens]KXW57238.1 hypothetical protein FEMY_22430 [Ferrovum myxofaciens]